MSASQAGSDDQVITHFATIKNVIMGLSCKGCGGNSSVAAQLALLSKVKRSSARSPHAASAFRLSSEKSPRVTGDCASTMSAFCSLTSCIQLHVFTPALDTIVFLLLQASTVFLLLQTSTVLLLLQTSSVFLPRSQTLNAVYIKSYVSHVPVSKCPTSYSFAKLQSDLETGVRPSKF